MCPAGQLAFPAISAQETLARPQRVSLLSQHQYQASFPFNLSAPNPNYLASDLANGVNVPLGLFAPNYKTPRSVQMNFGFQQELHRGTILTVDYLRNVTTHSLLGVDQNQRGRYALLQQI